VNSVSETPSLPGAVGKRVPFNKELSLSQLVLNHWLLSFAIIFTTICLAGLITLLIPNRYESQMKFLVSNERVDLVITPDKSRGNTVPSEVTETQVNSEMELLKSHDNLEAVVRDKKLYLPFENTTSPTPSRKSIQRAYVKLQKRLNITSMRKTNIVEVTYRDADPDLTVAVLLDLGEHYLMSHLAVHSVPGTSTFFSEQVETFATQLTHVRAELSAFHRKSRLFSMPLQQTAVVARFQSIDAQLKDVEAQVQEQQSRLGEISRQLAGTPERVVTQVHQVSNQQALQQLEPILTQLENRRIELTTKFKPNDRLVTETDVQIQNTRRELTRIHEERTDEKTTDLNTLNLGLNSDYTRCQVELTSLRTRRLELVSRTS
jgi:succinoglycan biosynthesis transport protein ExoP